MVKQRKEIQPALLTIPEVAHYLGLGKSMIYGLINDGHIPSVHIGKSMRVPKEGLDRWLNEKITAEAKEKHP
jgi:excisionase family DNA binding protein